MTIKDLGPRVASVWEGLRPETRKMLVGALQSKAAPTVSSNQRYAYDAHADWELSRLLSALDEQSKSPDSKANDEILNEISALADTCVRVLESQSGSAEVFIQLAERAIRKHDYNKLDTLSDRLAERFSAGEIAEIVRQTEIPQIRAIAYETLAMLPVGLIVPLLDDSLYADIAANALELKAFEFESDEARDALELYDYENEIRGE
jgi:hypothetical protein